jgi:hypothetical protein
MPYIGNVTTDFNVGTDNINNDAITTAKIADGAILDVDVNASAAIAGTKISPNFGSQAVVTTGTSTAASFIPTSSTVPTNGVYLPAANSVAISTNGSGRLFVDANGNIGAGVSVPGAIATGYTTLQIGGTNGGGVRVGTSSTAYGYMAGSASGVEIGTTGSTAFNLFTNNQTRATIDSSGRLGVGTSSPGTQFMVYGASGTAISLNNASTGTTGGSGFQLQTGSAGDAYVWNTSNSFIAFGTNNSERARIDSSGRLLVGTSTARSNYFNSTNTALLQVEGTAGGSARGMFSIVNNSTSDDPSWLLIGKSNGSSVGSNSIVNNGNVLGVLGFAGNDGSEFVTAAHILAEVDGTPGANDMPGRLVFSTTADGASSPTERMRVNSNGTTGILNPSPVDTLYLCNGSTAGTAAALLIGSHSASSMYGGTVSVRIYTNGNIQNTNNSYGSLSDVKLKENIVDAASQWDDLKALQVRNYNLKEGQTHRQIGLIAQEVEPISPGLVYESPDRDEEGNDLGTVTKSVNYSVLYMKAVKALQEAMERIETLEAKVAALEAV